VRALKYILLTLLGLAVLWLLLGLFAKNEYRIERSATIQAPLSVVHEQVRFFKNHSNWSPWLYLDPHAKITVTEPDGEVGTEYRWDGNEKIGKGSQIIQSVQPKRIEWLVSWNDFSESPAVFLFEELDTVTTEVTWKMTMRVPFPWNAFAMMTDLNLFVGRDFEAGLAHLKRFCEALVPKRYRGYHILDLALPDTTYAILREEVDIPQIGEHWAAQYPLLLELLDKAKGKPSGVPTGLFWTYDTLAMRSDMAAATMLEKLPKTGSPVQTLQLGGRALVLDFKGSYEGIGEAHNAIEDCMLDRKLRLVPPVIEEYHSGPQNEPDTTLWMTRIIYYYVTDSIPQPIVGKPK
jgi:hypothetical protein